MGWFTSASGGTEVQANKVYTSNTTIYAQWERITYTVTFQESMGNSLDFTSATTNSQGKLNSLATPTYDTDAFEFIGWSLNQFGSDYIDLNTVFTSDTRVYSKYNGSYTHMITFDANGGTVEPSHGFVTSLTNKLVGGLPTPTLGGSTFLEWNTSSDGSGDTVDNDYIYSGEITIYAIWA